MVGTCPKNKFRLPHRTKIDLTGDSPSQHPKTSKKAKQKTTMSSPNKPAAKSHSPWRERVPLIVKPLAVVPLEHHAEENAAEDEPTLQPSEPEQEEEFDDTVKTAEEPNIEKNPNNDEEDEPATEDAMEEYSEKAPESAPAKGKRKSTTTTPPTKRQRAAPSDTGSSLAIAEELEGKETTTPVIIKKEKPPRSAGQSTHSKTAGKAKVFTDTSNWCIVLPKAVDIEALKQLGVEKEVRWLFDNIGWRFFLISRQR